MSLRAMSEHGLLLKMERPSVKFDSDCVHAHGVCMCVCVLLMMWRVAAGRLSLGAGKL